MRCYYGGKRQQRACRRVSEVCFGPGAPGDPDTAGVHARGSSARRFWRGRITDRQTKVHFLYYFAPREAWREKIKEAARSIIEEFLQEEYYLPVYYAYRDCLTLPVEYLEKNVPDISGQSGQ